MRGKDHRLCRIFHLVELLDENRALGLQPFDDIFIVDDFMTHIDGRAMNPQCFLHSVDGAYDSRAKTARRAQKHMELWLYGHAATDPGINPFRCTTVRLSSPPRELPFPQTFTGWLQLTIYGKTPANTATSSAFNAAP